MLAIEVELLTGTYTATHFNDRNRPEWPPHPARLYSAMVAAWADVDDPDPTEADALRWFEGAGDPAITCSIHTDESDERPDEVAVRTATTHFVPVNDPAAVRDLSNAYRGLVEAEAELAVTEAGGEAKAIARATTARDRARAKASADSVKAATSGAAPTSALTLLPEERTKQARTFPTVRPVDPVATFTWAKVDPDPPTRATLDALLGRVGRLGHSSSLVSCRVVEVAPTPTMAPSPRGTTQIRLPGRGQLDRLQELFATHRGEQPRTLPSRMVRYSSVEPATPDLPRSVFAGRFHAATIEPWQPNDGDDARAEGLALPIRSSLIVARAVREAILSHAGQDGAVVPELISGHRPRTGGERSTPPSGRDHMAVVPLPFVGHPHADGLIKGVAVVLPHADPDDLHALEAALGRWLGAGHDAEDRPANLWGRGLGEGRWVVAPTPDEHVPVTLRRSRWSTAASTWATVTPIVLDRYPDGLWRGSAAKRARAEAQAVASITASCVRIGLPEPVHIEIRADAPVRGAAPLRRYEPFRSGPDNAPRPAVHAVIEFGPRVIGPVILGRGRYLGQGLCFPLPGDAR